MNDTLENTVAFHGLTPSEFEEMSAVMNEAADEAAAASENDSECAGMIADWLEPFGVESHLSSARVSLQYEDREIEFTFNNGKVVQSNGAVNPNLDAHMLQVVSYLFGEGSPKIAEAMKDLEMFRWWPRRLD